jgi:hypothetical protein
MDDRIGVGDVRPEEFQPAPAEGSVSLVERRFLSLADDATAPIILPSNPRFAAPSEARHIRFAHRARSAEGPRLQPSSPRTPRQWRRGLMVGRGQHRPAAHPLDPVAAIAHPVPSVTDSRGPYMSSREVFAFLAAKNRLITADADAVEAAFRERLATIEASAPFRGESQSAPLEGTASPVGKPLLVPTDDVVAAPIVLPSGPSARRRRIAAKIIRLRDKEHCKLVASQPCVICGRMPTEAHHIRFAQPRALGRKVSDEYTVPVCRLHHRELHDYGDEVSWWAGVGIDPLPIALELWRRSRLTYSLAATWFEPLADAIPPPAAKVERAPLDNDARDRSDVAEHPDRPPP